MAFSAKFDELLAKSQKLNTQLGIDTAGITQPLRRGLNELESSKNIGTATGRRLDEQDELNAVRLLAKNNFDAVGLAADVKDILVEAKHAPNEKLDSTDLDGYLARHHDMIILTTIDEARRGADGRVRNMQNRWLADQWASSRKNFLESLGHVTQQWSGSMSSSQQPGSALKAMTPTHPSNSKPFSTSGLAQFDSAKKSDVLAETRRVTDASNDATALLYKHATVIRNLDLETQKPTVIGSSQSQQGPVQRLKPFAALSGHVQHELDRNAGDGTGLSRYDLVGYKAALDMLADMTGESSSANKAPGYFSPVCFNANEVNPGLLVDKQQQLSLGAKASLEKQQWTIWSREIDECAHRDHLDVLAATDGSSRAQRIKAYVAYLWRVGSLYHETKGIIAMSSVGAAGSADASMPTWAYVYFSLAIGDVRGALQELDKCISVGLRYVEPAALTVLQILAPLLSSTDTGGSRIAGLNKTPKESVSYTLSASDRACLKEAMQTCAELYAQEVEMPDDKMDPYRALVLSLLSLNTKEMLVDPGLPSYTMQNYLWGCMWFVTVERIISQSPRTSSMPPAYALPDKAGEVALYNDILEYGGAEYFDPRQENPLKYATLLLTCHRFGDALAYLWTCGKTLPAVHIAMICMHYGLVLPYVPLAHNPTFAGASKFATKMLSIGNSLTPAAMLQYFFSQRFQLAHPEISADYFIGLNTNWLAHVKGMDPQAAEVHSLRSQNCILDVFQEFLTAMGAPQVAALVGDVPGEGSTMRGRLDDYLDKDQIGSLLSRSAFHLLTVRREASAAVHFYKLCGRYAEALEELCGQLSLVATVTSSPERTYWTNTCAEFFERYVRPGAGPLQQNLSRVGRYELISTFQQLLNVALFVTLCGENRWVDALQIVDDVSLLPRAESEVPAAVQAISGVGANALILRVIDDVILYVMDCLERLYYGIQENLQRGGSLTGASAVGGLLNAGELADSMLQLETVVGRARAVTAFTNAVGSRVCKPETISRVTRIQVGITK